MASLWGFPNPVNEKAARVVAGGVVVLAALTLITGWHWLIVLLAIGFAARVAAGPRFSLLGRLATQVIAPRLGLPKFVPGPPKRFAQAIGLVLTTAAAVLSLGFGLTLAGTVLIAILLIFAALESVVGFCAGCWLFALLMRTGIIPADTCESCNDIWRRYGTGAVITQR
ncbi:DUF4395 domain-containing protein [Microlunatus parietis]|uniref:DUF4395 domain-containing protein n=1 Tax=Microlunatus parietis TaxID=682979 RepID=A0A7Y9LD17_9ACTN|nr:DUF4395 domain-containing protein [Microlunatus parietis]NYE72433.1 hypothetical protein [Microlunatus parietis]